MRHITDYSRENHTLLKVAVSCLTLAVAILLVSLPAGCTSKTTFPTDTPADTREAAFEMEVDLLGTIHHLQLDEEGRLIAGTGLESTDGALLLSIARDTRLLDKDGEPLSSMSVGLSQENISSPEGASVISSIYSLGPQDAVLSTPLKLTLSYDPEKLPKEAREGNVYISPYDDSDGWGSSYYKMVDAERNQVTTLISRFTSYAVLIPIVVPQSTTPSVPQGLDVLEVVYFHRPQRCSGCVYAETGTRYTLENYFASELAEGKIVFKVINLADEVNAATVERYGAYTSSLFVNSIREGADHIEEVKEIWFVLGKDSEFVAIVKNKIESRLGEKNP